MSTVKIIRPASKVVEQASPLPAAGPQATEVEPAEAVRVAWPWSREAPSKKDNRLESIEESLCNMRLALGDLGQKIVLASGHGAESAGLITQSANVVVDPDDLALFRFAIPKGNLAVLSVLVLGAPAGPSGVDWALSSIEEGAVFISFANRSPSDRRALRVVINLWGRAAAEPL